MTKRKHSVFSKVLLIISLIFVVVIATSIILGYVYENRIKQFTVQQINNKIDAKINVDIIKLSFLSHFPDASLDFKTVSILPKDTNNSEVLLTANHIYFSFDIFDLLNENYSLKNVVLEDAKVNLLINKKGEHNFHVLKADTSKNNESKFLLNLDGVSIINSVFNYKNKATKQDLNLLVNNAKLSGNFSADNFKIKLVGNNIIESFSNSNREIIKDKTIDLDIIFTAEPNTGIYNLSKGNITYQGIDMNLIGDLSIQKKALKINASIIANNIDIQKSIKNIPVESRALIKKIKPTGKLDLKANISGYIGGRKSPHIVLTSNLKNASFYLEQSNTTFSNLQFQFDYNNGKSNDLKGSIINIKNLKTDSDLGKIEGKIQIINLWRPKVRMDIISSIKLDRVKDFIDVDTIKVMKGKAKLHSWINISLKYNDSLDSWGIHDIAVDNNFDISNATFAFNNSELIYDSIFVSGRMENDAITVKSFALLANDSKLNGRISIKNIPISLFQKSPKTLSLVGDVNANHLSFNQLVSAFPKSESSDSRFSNDIYLDLNLNVGSFDYENINATDISTGIIMNNRKLYFNSVTLNAFEGRLNSYFIIDGSKQGVYCFISQGNISNMNITTAFKQFNNFGQQTITDKNINGKLLSTYNYKCNFDDRWNILKSSIEMSADIEINNGELVGMTSLNALKDYTKIDDFSNIHFSTIKNNINIKDEKITIPEMKINSDKMNIDLYGVHDFDNKYEYHFVVLLSEVMGKHYQEKLKTEFGEVENDGYGKTRLFITMKGQGENFDVSYDRSGLGKKLKGDLKEEKASLKNALKEEFGLFKTDEEKVKRKRDSLKIKTKQREKDQIKKQEQGEFILKWDDDDEG